MQMLRENNFRQRIPQVKVEDGEEITYEAADAAMKRSIKFWSLACYLAFGRSLHRFQEKAFKVEWRSLDKAIKRILQNGDYGKEGFFECVRPIGDCKSLNLVDCSLFEYGPADIGVRTELRFCMYITGTLNTVFNEHIVTKTKMDGGDYISMGPSMVMCMVLNYLAMRILGEGPDGNLENTCARACKWILDNGSAMGSGSWGLVRCSVRALSRLSPGLGQVLGWGSSRRPSKVRSPGLGQGLA
ncbi:hypothetical protein L484_019095 [Morus notabilis]|uniref:Squalene cyclase N-terminal domain-containing protein n=1 Tax=Morus notabilis TaxID=981085 RepID=W9SBB0_9ROSA|nr:hypothetical protein L484_019095 [Morus notabilis]